jgi:hypothetical protein
MAYPKNIPNGDPTCNKVSHIVDLLHPWKSTHTGKYTLMNVPKKPVKNLDIISKYMFEVIRNILKYFLIWYLNENDDRIIAVNSTFLLFLLPNIKPAIHDPNINP